MFDPNQIPETEKVLASKGVSVAELCRRAEISESTWGRWKNNTFMPSYRVAKRVDQAISDILADPKKETTGATQ